MCIQHAWECLGASKQRGLVHEPRDLNEAGGRKCPHFAARASGPFNGSLWLAAGPLGKLLLDGGNMAIKENLTLLTV